MAGMAAAMGRVLLVEDEINIAEAIRFLLTREGWQVDVHADGTDAVAKIGDSAPDLVILDLMLPGKSGLEIIKELRQKDEFSDLPVLMLTARGALKDREMAERAGVTRFMTKPFANSEVLTAVRDLRAQALQRQSARDGAEAMGNVAAVASKRG